MLCESSNVQFDGSRYIFKRVQRKIESYYRQAIKKGLITVNEQQTTPDTVIKHHDMLCHTVHRHEPPVTDQPIDIMHETEDLLVINKPGSIQVHPSGRYRHNTVVHILRKELNYDILYPSNRLDRVTSGIMLISKNAIEADRIGKEMRGGNIKKEYICRVSGKFPDEQMVCTQPIKQLAHTVALNYVHTEGGKHCTTVFDRISYNGQTSLVRCRLLKGGRTHQIRVHLRYLGFPIANDPIYGYSTAWSNQLPFVGQELKDPSSVIQTMIDVAPYDYMDDDPLNLSGSPRCLVCNVPVPPTDPIPAQLALWLHAYKYSSPSWSYQTPALPLWAQDAFKHEDMIVPASF
ncbi:unnamed protein product [Mucor hiemalis]